MIRFPALFFVLLLLFWTHSPGFAANGTTQAFVSQDGFTPTDPDTTWQAVNAALAASDTLSALSPAANLGPMPLAVFAVEAIEPALERTRYRLRYGVRWTQQPPAADPVPFSYIEVIRFNLGPAIRQELVQVLGEENVADAGQFGTGPHLGWRFVTRPLMGNRAMIMAAGRREFTDAAARNKTCFQTPCITTASTIESAAPWSDPAPDNTHKASTARRDGMDPMSAAHAIQILLGPIDSLETPPPSPGQSHPEWLIEAVVERNLGQDDGLDAAYRHGGLMDDSVKAIWERRIAFPATTGNPPYFSARADECARGPAFAPPGQYCP